MHPLKHFPTRVYFASKMHHAETWREIRAEHTDIHFTARWPYLEPTVEPTPDQAAHFWADDYRDIEDANVVICYGDSGDVLRGAIAECGAALMTGRYVILVCPDDTVDFGTWQYHPNCRRVKTIGEALDLAKGLTI